MSNEEVVDVQVWEQAAKSGDRARMDELSHKALQGVATGNVALSFVAELIRNNYVAIRDAATWIASELGEAASPLLPACIEALHDPEATVRYNAISTILALGDWGFSSSSRPVFSLLHDPDPLVRRIAIQVLLNVADTSLYRKLHAIQTEGTESFRVAADCLLRAVVDPGNADGLQTAIQDDARIVRLAALVAGLKCGRAGTDVIAQALRSPDPTTREHAAEFAHYTDSKDRAIIIPILVEAIRIDRVDAVRSACLHSMDVIGIDDLGPDRHLVFSATTETSDEIRFNALCVIGHLSELAEDELEFVIQRLDDSCEGVRFVAGQCLFRVARTKLDGFVDRLFSIALNTEKDVAVRIDILRVLATCSEKALTAATFAAQSSIARALANSNEDVVSGILFALSRCAKLPDILVSGANLALNSASSEVQRMARLVLNPFGKDG